MWSIKGRLQNENSRQVSDSVKQRLSWWWGGMAEAEARQPLHCETGYCRDMKMWEGVEKERLDRQTEEGGRGYEMKKC